MRLKLSSAPLIDLCEMKLLAYEMKFSFLICANFCMISLLEPDGVNQIHLKHIKMCRWNLEN